jgi:hypothetical protein
MNTWKGIWTKWGFGAGNPKKIQSQLSHRVKSRPEETLPIVSIHDQYTKDFINNLQAVTNRLIIYDVPPLTMENIQQIQSAVEQLRNRVSQLSIIKSD